MNILKLAAQLVLDGTRYKAGLKEAEVASTRFGANVSKDIKGRLAGAFSVGALGFGAKRLIDLNSQIKDTATALDISTDAFQEQSYWLTQNGAEAGALTAAYKGLAKARAEALGGDEKKMGLFELMGIDADTLEKSSIEQLFKSSAEAFRNTDFGADKIAVALDLFGKGGMQILPALESSLSAAADEAQRFGQIIESGVVNNLEAAGDSIDRLIGTMRGPLSQAVSWTVDGIRNAFTAINLLWGTVSSFAGGLSTGSLSAAKDRASEFFNKTMDEWSNGVAATPKRKMAGSAYLEEPEDEIIKEKVAREVRERAGPRDQGDPGRANEVSSLTRTGQLSARDATMTAREPVEKLIELARTQLAVEKEQAASLKVLEQRKPTRINAHY